MDARVNIHDLWEKGAYPFFSMNFFFVPVFIYSSVCVCVCPSLYILCEHPFFLTTGKDGAESSSEPLT